ncbi:EAL domain-containing protein [Thiohalobacter sp. IOR34]|uniref:EAL domain-containing protein n=1 Tax=Thiohalobacter sp. IOR34 TaxID=3057176 RepID=UPI0025B02CCE|nr:EAL domain-containing protein [Thiohalobacter sp. IOR34]WJW76038.1 EAL domain-containing protein [Thiohalobacter sp. IOR34]
MPPETSVHKPGRWLRLDRRRIINASSMVLALLVLLLALSSGWTAYQRYREAGRIHSASTLADRTITLSAVAALERGITSAMLGAGNGGNPRLRAMLIEVRGRGDRLWSDFHSLAQAFPGSPAFRQALVDVLAAHQAVIEGRRQADRALAGQMGLIDESRWIELVSRFNQSLEQVRHTLFYEGQWPQRLTVLNLSLRHWVWLVSEYAGRERGILAYYISSGAPLPEERRADLRTDRALVEHHVREILVEAVRPGMDPRIRSAALEMQRRFMGAFNPLRERIYAHAARGDYPLSGEAWIQAATTAIDSVLDLARTVTEVSTETAQGIRRDSARQLGYRALIVALALFLLLLSLTKVRETTNALFHEKELAEVTLHSIGDAVITTDAEARVEYLNPVAEEFTGWSSSEAAGRPLSEVVRLASAFSHEPHENPVERCLREKRVVGLAENTLLIRRDGKEFAIEDSAAPIHDLEGNIVGAVMVFYDVSENHGHAPLLAHYAAHDALTGLANRREFERRLIKLLDRAKRLQEQHALCYIDLDQFKVVNDTCGHVVGDKLLRQLTYVLEQHVRDTDTLARLGGDEFGLLLENCPLPQAREIAENIRNMVKEFRFVWDGKAFDVGCSIGLVPITAESISPAELLSEADAACYAAKEKGRNRVQVFEPGDIELARRSGEMQWVSRLRAALREDRLLLYVQDIRPLNGNRPLHREILLRLRDEEGQIVPPMCFIPAAERYNLMPELDQWVIEHTLDWIWRRDPGQEGVVYNINLSGTSVSDSPRLLEFIERQLERRPVAPQRICFEITETAAVQNLAQLAELIEVLKGRGFRFALDDFGSGLSSFMYLKTLPVDFLKIDGSFVRDMLRDPIDLAMVQSINTIGHVMQIETIAEFVEDAETHAELRRLGVDFGQGFGIDRPRPLA